LYVYLRAAIERTNNSTGEDFDLLNRRVVGLCLSVKGFDRLYYGPIARHHGEDLSNRSPCFPRPKPFGRPQTPLDGLNAFQPKQARNFTRYYGTGTTHACRDRDGGERAQHRAVFERARNPADRVYRKPQRNEDAKPRKPQSENPVTAV
jgi:hypothetical protein